MRKSLIPLPAVAALALLIPAPPAHAVSKEMVQLQTQVQQLQDMVQHLQTSNDQNMGALQHMIQQTADNVARMSQTLNTLQQQVESQNGQGGKVDQLSGQIQGVNDSIDELKTRMAKLDKTLQDIQTQLTNVQSQPAGQPQQGQPGMAPQGQPQGNMQQSGPQAMGGAPAQPQQPQAPPVDQLYQSALRDYTGGRYDVASGEFGDVIKYYPQDDLAGNAYFYLGEMAYRKGDYPTAIQNYDAVLEQFSGSPKAPASQLHKGESELAANQKDAGIRDLRSLIQRYPQTPEAAQGRSRLNAMGVRIVAAKPSAYR